MTGKILVTQQTQAWLEPLASLELIPEHNWVYVMFPVHLPPTIRGAGEENGRREKRGRQGGGEGERE